MLVISYLYRLSERQSEEIVNMHLAVKECVGLEVDEGAPDHSTLALFRRRLEEAGCWEQCEAMGDEVLRQVRAAGVKLGAIQVVDSVHSVADVDKEADQRRGQGMEPRDAQAQVMHKGERRVREADGEVRVEEMRYLGYKSHASLNAESGLITSLWPTVGSVADNEQFGGLLKHDEQTEVGAQMYTGDRAYDDSNAHWPVGC